MCKHKYEYIYLCGEYLYIYQTFVSGGAGQAMEFKNKVFMKDKKLFDSFIEYNRVSKLLGQTRCGDYVELANVHL